MLSLDDAPLKCCEVVNNDSYSIPSWSHASTNLFNVMIHLRLKMLWKGEEAIRFDI